jgi:hypothetical protein
VKKKTPPKKTNNPKKNGPKFVKTSMIIIQAIYSCILNKKNPSEALKKAS